MTSTSLGHAKLGPSRTPEHRNIIRNGSSRAASPTLADKSLDPRRRDRRDGRPGVEEDGVVMFLVPHGAVGGAVAVVAEELVSRAQGLRGIHSSHATLTFRGSFGPEFFNKRMKRSLSLPWTPSRRGCGRNAGVQNPRSGS